MTQTNPMSIYDNFLAQKAIVDRPSGFDVSLDDLNPMLFDWQKVLDRWALRRGRAAIFADCGLGKTPMQLVWGQHVSREQDAPILILAPLAVSEQTKQEGVKFGISVHVSSGKGDVRDGINITNYEKLHKFDPSVFCGIVVDESSILKSFSAVTRNEIIGAFHRTPYRLSCTATPAPNDYVELGNQAEFLGVMTRSEMLSTFFINDTSDTGTWRLKGHVQGNLFWSWLASWAAMISKPSDLGFDDNGFILPKIHYHEHIIKTTAKPKYGFLPDTVTDLKDRRRVRRDTLDIRCSFASNLINATDEKWVVWCNLNDEGEQLTDLIAGAVEVAGKHDNDLKAKRMLDFANGEIERLVTKPKIAGRGMNWQVCSHAMFVGLNDSWEDLYQTIRRIWRFGQERECHIHIVIEEREGPVLKNLKEKEQRAQAMISAMVGQMKDLTRREVVKASREFVEYNPTEEMRLPEWLK